MNDPLITNPHAHFNFNEMTNQEWLKPKRVIVKRPTIGYATWLLKQRGTFVLETKPTQLLVLACTNAGSGALKVIDGVPDANGYFPSSAKEAELEEIDPETAFKIIRADYNGKEIYHANPAILQMWFFQAGLNHGLTVISAGEHISTPPFATITWELKR